MKEVPFESGDRLSQFSEETWRKITEFGSVITCSKGEWVQLQGATHDELHVVLTGSVDMKRDSGSGSRKTGIVKLRSQTLSNASVHLKTQKMLGAQASVDGTRILVLKSGQVYELMAQYPDFQKFVVHDLSEQLLNSLRYLQEDREMRFVQRFAKRLLEVTADTGEISLSQNELADALGVSRMTISKSIKSFVARGFVEQRYGKLRIKDRSAFAAFVDKG